jgi:hypothetical protein
MAQKVAAQGGVQRHMDRAEFVDREPHAYGLETDVEQGADRVALPDAGFPQAIDQHVRFNVELAIGEARPAEVDEHVVRPGLHGVRQDRGHRHHGGPGVFPPFGHYFVSHGAIAASHEITLALQPAVAAPMSSRLVSTRMI